jgi:hypothetical protein
VRTGTRQRRSVSDERFTSALRILGAVEVRLGRRRPWRPRSYRTGGLVAVRTSVEATDLVAPPSLLIRQVADDGPVLRARCRAEVIRIGKFDLEQVVRFRAFQVDGDRPTALRIQGHGDDHGPGVAREIRARRSVARHVPELAPQLLDAELDADRGIGWLREELIVGRHPRTAAQTRRAVEQLVPGLRRLHDRVGVSHVPFSRIAGGVLDRWDAATEAGILPRSLAGPVRRLVTRDADVQVSLGHGDLVRTNIVRRGGEVVLIDWEKARSMPIANDLAKLLPLVGTDVERTLTTLRDAFGATIAPTTTSYTFDEQFVLAVVQTLSTALPRAERARRAGREERFAETQQRQVALLDHLLERAAG